MDLLQLPDAHLGINRGSVQFGLTRQLLDVSDVGTILQHQSSTGMPEQMHEPDLPISAELMWFLTNWVILLDPKAYPAHVLCDLYFQRWDVELFFCNIKITMGLDVLRCLTPQMIVKEILMHFIAYNGIRHLMLEAALSKNQAVSRISFKGCLQALHQWLPNLGNLQMKTQPSNKIITALLHAIAHNVISKRPGRSEPRAVKRRPKPHLLMTAPRQQMNQILQQEKQCKSPLS